MKVSELVAVLQKYPQDIQVAYRMCSEQLLLDAEDIKLVELCEPRADGWIHSARPDKPKQTYLLFPGN